MSKSGVEHLAQHPGWKSPQTKRQKAAERAKKERELVWQIARMKTEEEFGDDAPPSEDWITTLNELITSARRIRGEVKLAGEPMPSGECPDCGALCQLEAA